ncbi:type VI secretion system membrane subunit TssM [Vibrio mediterranei]
MADGKKKKTTAKPLISGISSGFLLCILLLVTVWLTPALKTYLVIAIALCIILSGILGFFVYWFSRKNSKPNDPDENKKKELVTRRCQLLQKHFQNVLKVQKTNKRLQSRYDLPVYLWFSDKPQNDFNVITQMGYEAYQVDEFGNDIEFPILFWLSEHSLVISVSQGDDQHPEYLKTLYNCLKKWRPRQALNGLLLATSADTLLGQKEAIKMRADQIKADLTRLNRTFGLSIPVYSIITHSSSISDFCQYFSGFEDARREDAFGSMMPFREHGGIDADWYDHAYDALIGQLIANMTSALSGQLNLDYRKSIAAAPLQFGLLKQNLWLQLNRIFGVNQLGDGLMFRGFFFTHEGSDSKNVDALAATISNDLGHEFYHPKSSQPVQQVLFAQHLMTHALIPEQMLVGVNKKKENWLLTMQTTYTLLCALLLIAILAIIKFDFDFQSQREARADALLERYKEAITASPYDVENLADNIPNLYSLRKIYELYNKPEPWYVLPFMPSYTIKPEVEVAYITELQAVLMPSLEKSLANDLFVYVNLEEQATTLSLLNSYRLLFTPNKNNTEELRAYFVQSLEDQGVGTTSTLNQLTSLLDDAFANHLIPEESNTDLEQLARKVINQTGIETLLYQHIKSQTKYANRIDIRSELGSNYSQVYSFSSGYVGYLVPHIYTPSGFTELDLSVDSPIIKEALSAYAGVAGEAPSALEMYRISRDLRQLYKNDYINYWKDFTNNIVVNPVKDDTELSRLLTLLTNAGDNPIQNYYNTVSKYTTINLEPVEPTKDEKAAEKEQTPIDQDQMEAMRLINVSFSDFHSYVSSVNDAPKPVDQWLAAVKAAKTYLDTFYQAEDARKLAYDTLAKPLQSSNPIAAIQLITSTQPTMTKSLSDAITQLSNDAVLSLAHQHLNLQWKNSVLTTFQSSLASYYPFSKNAETDASVADVKAFFSSSGAFEAFNKKYLNSFLQGSEGSPYLPGLLPRSGLEITQEVWDMVDVANQIRSALFLASPDNVSVKFQMKALTMSPKATEFMIYSDQPLFTYRHGPTLWKSISWDGEQQAEDNLNIELKDSVTSLSQSNFSGNWNWFKLINSQLVKADNQGAEISVGNKGEQIRLSVKTQGQVNPFTPNFFTQFKLPENI